MAGDASFLSGLPVDMPNQLLSGIWEQNRQSKTIKDYGIELGIETRVERKHKTVELVY